MKLCLNCEEENFLMDKFCSKCGKDKFHDITLRCPKCDMAIGKTDTFCVSCGTKIGTPKTGEPKKKFNWRIPWLWGMFKWK